MEYIKKHWKWLLPTIIVIIIVIILIMRGKKSGTSARTASQDAEISKLKASLEKCKNPGSNVRVNQAACADLEKQIKILEG